MSEPSQPVQACKSCGHIRYEADQFDGRCYACERWAEDQIRALRARVERLELELHELQQYGVMALESGYGTLSAAMVERRAREALEGEGNGDA